jgi:hypothetical protein
MLLLPFSRVAPYCLRSAATKIEDVGFESEIQMSSSAIPHLSHFKVNLPALLHEGIKASVRGLHNSTVFGASKSCLENPGELYSKLHVDC